VGGEGVSTSVNPRGLPEATRDPIFLLQSKQRVWTDLPAGWSCLDGTLISDGTIDNVRLQAVWPEARLDEDGLLSMSLSDVQERLDGRYCTVHWQTERVFFTREEGEAWAEARAYNYPNGWRVYCVCCEGRLAEILKAADEAQEVKA
jgi:hypothetical protein